jgi:tetratricopeptide (TPR) repeat protein
MGEIHITRAGLQKFLEQGADERQKRLLLHQLAVCPKCYAVGGYILDLYRAGAIDIGFGPVDLALAQSRAAAPKLWEALRPEPAEKRRTAVLGNPRFRTWGMCELLCLESAREATRSPAVALELAGLAVELSTELREGEPAEIYWLYELRAYAWAHLGNARRVAGELLAAEEAFAQSGLWWTRGYQRAGDAVGYEARMLALKASHRRAQRRFPEALALLDRALAAGAGLELTGTILINKAKVLGEVGETEKAIALLSANASRVEAAGDSRLVLCLWHNLLDLLSRAGRHREACALLPKVERLAREAGGDIDRLRLRWIQARVAAGLGDAEGAIERLAAVRRDFVAQQIAFDAALVSLELALLLVTRRRLGEVKALASETHAIFEALAVHREAVVALAVFRQAAEAETLTAELLERLAVYLRRVQRDPTLRFMEPDSPFPIGALGDEERAC